MSMRGTLAGLLLCLAATAHADPLSQVVERYLAWRGGTAFEQLQSVHERGSLTASDLNGSQELWLREGGTALRLEVDLGVVRQTQVVSSGHSWELTPAGQVQTLALSDADSLRRAALLQFADALRGRGGATAQLLPGESREGRTFDVVRVSFGDADTYDAFIDPLTGELAGFRIREDRRGRFEAFSDWRLVEGVRMPFLQTTRAEVAGDDQVFAVHTLEVNASVPEALVARPLPVRRTSFAAGASGTGWIPFEFQDGSHIFFDARVNGRRTRVLLDSGATVSAIDSAYARTLGLDPQGRFSAAGTGGITTAGFAAGLTVRVGNLTVHNLKALSLDLAPVATRMAHPLPFVLGDEVFNELAVDIDFTRQRLAFRDARALAPPQGATEVPLRRIFGNRSVPVAIEGAPAVEFEFDLGNGSLPQVYPALYGPRALLQGRRTSQLLGGAVGGFEPWTVATLRTLTFAGVQFHDVPAQFAPDTLSGANSNRVVGNIGNSILARFHLIIDYSHDRLYALPEPGARSAPFSRDRLGIATTRKGATLLVDFVSPASPAQAAGFRVGDAVTRINGRSVAAWSPPALRELRLRPAGTALDFTLKDGTTRHLKLTDFF